MCDEPFQSHSPKSLYCEKCKALVKAAADKRDAETHRSRGKTYYLNNREKIRAKLKAERAARTPEEVELDAKKQAEQKQRRRAAELAKLAERDRLKNVQGLDLKTGLRASLAAHRASRGKKPYQMASDIYPDSSDPFNAIKQLFRRIHPVIKDEQQRVADLTDDQRETEVNDLEARLKRELAKPLKKS